MRVLNLAGRSNPQFGASFLELEEILNALFSDDFNVVGRYRADAESNDWGT
jgi:hypothetical protein